MIHYEKTRAIAIMENVLARPINLSNGRSVGGGFPFSNLKVSLNTSRWVWWKKSVKYNMLEEEARQK